MAPRSATEIGGDAAAAIEAAAVELRERGFPDALWSRDGSAWPRAGYAVEPWLGWVPVVDEMAPRAGELMRWAAGVRAELPDTTLLGMGGSSLCAEVLRQTFALGSLSVLDTTHPEAVRREERDGAVYITASKSGGTIETRSHDAYFFRRTGEDPSRFVAVTDPGTALAGLATERGYRRVFENREDIGGRYSALSYFGLVPAALAGLDVERLLASAVRMAQACRARDGENPGLDLGAALGALARRGRDKVTLVCTGPHASFGVWAEQLLAESTGKEGAGLVPVAGERLGPPDVYGDDRVFVHLRGGPGDDDALGALADAGHPVITLAVEDPYDVGAEFFRWEVATALAGSLLEINPFDQPNVQQAKDNTGRLLAEWESAGALPRAEADDLADVLRALEPGGYLAILAYVDPGGADAALYDRVRLRLRDTLRVATTFGYGPRYLHSTGQLHKGGPPVGVFLQVVDPDPPDLAIPGQRYGFGTLFAAQSLGDLQTLRSRGRPVARVTPDELEAAVESAIG